MTTPDRGREKPREPEGYPDVEVQKQTWGRGRPFKGCASVLAVLLGVAAGIVVVLWR